MSSASQDLVIRMKTDSQNFNDGIEKAKGKVKDFKKEGEGAGNSFKGSMAVATKALGKIAIAVGAATAAIKTYNSFAQQSQYFGDKLESSLEACKSTWNSLQHEIIMGGNIATSQIRNLYNEAKKLAELRDELGTDVISQRFFRMKYLTPFNEGVTEYQEAKKAGNKGGMQTALEKATRALNDYSSNSQKLINDAEQTVIQYLKKEKISVGNKSAMDLMEELVNAQQGYFTEETRVFEHYFKLSQDAQRFGNLNSEYRNEIWAVKHPTYMTGRYGVDMPYGYEGARYAMQIKGYTKEQIDAAERQYRLSQITDKEYTEALDILETGNNVMNELIQLQRRLTRMQEKEPTTPTYTPNIETHGKQELIPQLMPKQFTGTIQFSPNGAQPLDEDWLANEMAQYEYEQLILQEALEEQRKAWQKQIEMVNGYADSLGYLSNMFGSLSEIANDDTPWKKFMVVLSSVASNIGSLIKTYTSLVAVEAVQQAIASGEGIPFPYNLIIMAAAGAAIAGIIATVATQAKSQSYATGGIVGGHNYNDGIVAHVSSGEMIINRQQQLNLWRLINSATPFGIAQNLAQNVEFIIRGEDLVGAIDNYNKNQSY